MSTQVMPSADLVFESLFAYQKSAALKSAVELDLFTAIDDGAPSASAIAQRANARLAPPTHVERSRGPRLVGTALRHRSTRPSLESR
jgi:hypothetical protein